MRTGSARGRGCTGCGPLLPSPVYSAYADEERYPLPCASRDEAVRDELRAWTENDEQHVTPPSAFASSPAGTGSVTSPSASRRRLVRGCSSAQMT